MSDWRQAIADAAASTLSAPGAVVVRVTEGEPPAVFSRRYERRLRRGGISDLSIAWTRASRLFNTDPSGASYYVVQRLADGDLVVWAARDMVLLEIAAGHAPDHRSAA